jgi:hypothetical protein
MQKVAAYRFERNTPFASSQELVLSFSTCIEVLLDWLKYKRADQPNAQKGSYCSKDNGKGTFEWSEALDESREWKSLRLDETAADGRRHIADVTVIRSGFEIVVYVSVEAGLSFSTIKQFRIDPRCPRVVRELLSMPGGWYHGASEIKTLQRAEGSEAGEKLAEEILQTDRTLPIVVISQNADECVIPGLERTLSFDLQGLANIVTVDNSAAWALTAFLGRQFSCHSEAVRIYWPLFSMTNSPFDHPLWTADRLLRVHKNPAETLQIFSSQIRRAVMPASALSVLRPHEIDDIQTASHQRRLNDLLSKAGSATEWKELLRIQSEENQSLQKQLLDTTKKIKALEEETKSLKMELENANSNFESLSRYRDETGTDIDPVGPNDAEIDDSPEPNEYRYYKKVSSGGKRDTMVRIQDCGCNNWRSAHKADKAENGIEKLEGKSDWKTLHKCMSCTGGGVWRVRW